VQEKLARATCPRVKLEPFAGLTIVADGLPGLVIVADGLPGLVVAAFTV
jgi:hypothetical protein